MNFGISKSAIRKINRMILRLLPIIPGPEMYDLIIELRQGNKTINSKIEKAYESLKETSNLIRDLEIDLQERTEKVRELKEKYEEYSKLAEIEEDKIKPLLKQLDESVTRGKTRERVISFVINIGAGILIFILGIWASPIAKEWISEIQNDDTENIEIQDYSKKDESSETAQNNGSSPIDGSVR